MSEISKEAAMVRDALLAQGLETPRVPIDMSHDEQRAEIEKHMGAIMDILGLDRSDDSLNRTPYRIAKMYVNEIFSGLDYFPRFAALIAFRFASWLCPFCIRSSALTTLRSCSQIRSSCGSSSKKRLGSGRTSSPY